MHPQGNIEMSRSGWILGVWFIFLVAVLWTGGSILTQYIYSDLDFRSPFLLTYISSSLFALYLPIWWILCAIGTVKDPPWSDDNDDIDKIAMTKSQIGIVNGEKIYACHQKTIAIALALCPLWFIANFLYEYSLLLSSISSTTIISNLSGAFTLMFSGVAGVETVSYLKVIGVALCFLGATLVATSDARTSDDDNSANPSVSSTVGGDVMAALAAAGYGLYTTYLKFKVRDDISIAMPLLLGYMGALNAAILSPIVVILCATGVEGGKHFTSTVFAFLMLGGLIDYVLSDYLWARAVVLTTPTIATVGLSITIPMAFVADILFSTGVKITAMAIVGSVIVVVGFIVVNVSPSELDPKEAVEVDAIEPLLAAEIHCDPA